MPERESDPLKPAPKEAALLQDELGELGDGGEVGHARALHEVTDRGDVVAPAGLRGVHACRLGHVDARFEIVHDEHVLRFQTGLADCLADRVRARLALVRLELPPEDEIGQRTSQEPRPQNGIPFVGNSYLRSRKRGIPVSKTQAGVS
jgi:hypothetical protein